ncbi:alpha-galactosidase [Collimonas humicola]|uniref:alpha-galactosidase n=1 Tax=Collimonas humicola TaxID=2825886 RepID=UPI001B8B5F46|nr:alpha-galactosidase [Collimonas humicola]
MKTEHLKSGNPLDVSRPQRLLRQIAAFDWRMLAALLAALMLALCGQSALAGNAAFAIPAGAQSLATVAQGQATFAGTPPMGFTTWARFLCNAQTALPSATPLPANAPLNQDLGNPRKSHYSFQHFMLDQAQALVDTGLRDKGYTQLNVDDCWMDKEERGNPAALQGGRAWVYGNWWTLNDPSQPQSATNNYSNFLKNNQPGFDSDLTNYVSYIHGLGMKVGLYSSSGQTTCQVYPASGGNETNDAAAFAKWRIDFLKYDNCGAGGGGTKTNVQKMAAALAAQSGSGSSPKILFDISLPAAFGQQSAQFYDVMDFVRGYGQMWRVSGDIANYSVDPTTGYAVDPWTTSGGYDAGIYPSFRQAANLARYVAPARWNDPDQLLIGDNGQTADEERSQFALWSILGAPLILSTDIRKLTAANLSEIGHVPMYNANEHLDDHFRSALKTLSNAAIIKVDQDPLGAGGYIAWQSTAAADSGMDIVVKPLANHDTAVVVLNKGASASAATTFSLATLGYPASAAAGTTVTITDLWSGTSTVSAANTFKVPALPAHGNAMYRISVAASQAPVDIAPTGPIFVNEATGLCLAGHADGSSLTIESCNGGAQQLWQRDLKNNRVCLSGQASCLTADRGQAVLKARDLSNQGQDFTYYLNGMLVNAKPASGAAASYPVIGNTQCLDISYGRLTPSSTVAIYPCNSGVPPTDQTIPAQINQLWSAPGAADKPALASRR